MGRLMPQGAAGSRSAPMLGDSLSTLEALPVRLHAGNRKDVLLRPAPPSRRRRAKNNVHWNNEDNPGTHIRPSRRDSVLQANRRSSRSLETGSGATGPGQPLASAGHDLCQEICAARSTPSRLRSVLPRDLGIAPKAPKQSLDPCKRQTILLNLSHALNGLSHASVQNL